MIKEIYIDNFRCLSNFRIAPQKFQLWLGDNGSGKTSTLDALRCIQSVLSGRSVVDIFKGTSLSKWDRRRVQILGVTLNLDGETYKYEVVIEHEIDTGRCRIKKEQLTWKGDIFFLFDDGEAHLFRINRSSSLVEEGAKFSADWSRSVIPTVAARGDNAPLIRFREETQKWLIVQPVPLVMKEVAESEARKLTRYSENFAQWYRHVLQENPGIGYKARDSLSHVLPGFEELSLRDMGETRKLRATFRIGDKEEAFDFIDLSDGQRQLIVLYTLLESLKQDVFSVLLIDEPDNFVSLREIEPWLASLQETCEENSTQSIIISHHPEIINKMAHGTELWFSRERGTYVVTKECPTTPGLTPAETLARGWDDG